MLRHCVFINFKPGITESHKNDPYGQIENLKPQIPGMVTVHHGKNTSPEIGMDKGFSDGFIVDFVSAGARDAYLANADHGRIGAQIVQSAVDGVSGILVYDLEIAD